MSRSLISLTAGAALLVGLLATPPARASDAPGGSQRFVPVGPAAGLGPEPRRAAPVRAGVSASKRQRARDRRARRAVAAALTAARAPGGISRAAYVSYRDLYARARRTRKLLDGARGRELGAVLATVEEIALRDELTSSRMKAVFLILKRNVEFWPRRPFPRDHDRLTFRGSQLVFEYYRGRGLQLQPLVNFKKANLMHAACVRDTGAPCERGGLARLLDEMAKVSARRGGFRAWEYYFDFGGGRPPWVSGMAQATGVQALGRSAQLLGDSRLLGYAREALGAFRTAPPVGIATRGPLGGTHYLQYSFAPRLYILNAFLQSVIGLLDYARITGDANARELYEDAEPEARAEVPRHDTGEWSKYSYRGRDSTAAYHELLREFLQSLCDRLRASVYCDTADRFALYATEPPELELLGPDLVTRGERTRVRFSLSKLSAVQITITRGGRLALDRVATFRRGRRSFAWRPRATGVYSIRLAAKELRTGRDLRARVSGQVGSFPPD